MSAVPPIASKFYAPQRKTPSAALDFGVSAHQVPFISEIMAIALSIFAIAISRIRSPCFFT
jgi:hypothetical protein